jgi:hypothetical protein
MNYLKLITAIVVIVFLTACSTNQGKLQDKWWYKVSNYGDDIIMFSSDGKAKNMNDDKQLDYSLEGNTVYLGKDTLTITKIDEKYLTLSKGKKTLEFRIADDKDYLIGEWNGSYNGKEFSIDFQKDGDYKSKMDKKRNKGSYKVEVETLKVDNDKYVFSLSKDLNNLSLKNDELEVELYRDL